MNDVDIRAGEAVEPLDGTHAIIQPVDGYRFGRDAVALADFASRRVKRGMRVFDMCSGCGIVGILVAISTGASVVGAETDGRLCDMSARSAVMNGLDASFYNADIRKFDDCANAHIFTRGGFDAVVCNPPFFKAESRSRKVAPSANSELTATFCDVAACAAWLLKQGGALFLVHTATRLDEVVITLDRAGLTPKDLTVNRNGKTFLLRAVKGGRAGLNVTTEDI